MSLAIKQIGDQSGHTPLANRLVVAAEGARVDVCIDRETGDRVRYQPPTDRLFAVEVQLALAGQEKLAQRAAELAELGRVDDGGGDEVAAVPR